jgi:hypothetical protein
MKTRSQASYMAKREKQRKCFSKERIWEKKNIQMTKTTIQEITIKTGDEGKNIQML